LGVQRPAELDQKASIKLQPGEIGTELSAFARTAPRSRWHQRAALSWKTAWSSPPRSATSAAPKERGEIRQLNATLEQRVLERTEA